MDIAYCVSSIKSSGADLGLVGCLYLFSRPVLLRGPESFFVRGSCGHCNHWLGQLCVQSSVCRLVRSIIISIASLRFFPGFMLFVVSLFSWRVANVNVNKQWFHLKGSLNSRSDALSGLHRVFFQQFSPGGSCPPHYGAFSPGLAKLKDQARAWFFFFRR